MASERELSTKRLTLIALSRDQLKAYLIGGSAFQQVVGAASLEILTPILKRAIGLKLEKMTRANPGDWPWITYWLIRISPGDFGAGLIGYKGPPDSKGEVEIGYGIDPAYRGQGYTTEALLAMIIWAFADTNCLRILAPETLRSNPASNRVLQKAGFRVYAEDSRSISWCLDKSHWEGC
jgi:ribosomal-protein-alanine N-acetyltransferase